MNKVFEKKQNKKWIVSLNRLVTPALDIFVVLRESNTKFNGVSFAEHFQSFESATDFFNVQVKKFLS